MQLFNKFGSNSFNFKFGNEYNGQEQIKAPDKQDTGCKYNRRIRKETVDVYDVLMAWQVHNPAIQHAIKKLLQPGMRGHKSRLQDLNEALASIQRAIELESE